MTCLARSAELVKRESSVLALPIALAVRASSRPRNSSILFSGRRFTIGEALPMAVSVDRADRQKAD
jgi:hypothetical protein